MTDTPRTDAVDYAPVRFWKVHAYELACSSRQLERELNASKAEVERLKAIAEDAKCDLIRTQIEMQLLLDKAEAEVERLRSLCKQRGEKIDELEARLEDL